MPKMQEQFSALCSDMRALLPPNAAMLGELYGARFKSEKQINSK